MTFKPKLTFTLQQHTPIIHFQYDQPGATIRATELKPKLDKFIIKKMGGWKKINDDWKVDAKDDEKKALNYKVKINAGEKDKAASGAIENSFQDYRGRTRKEKFPTFFGLMGEDGGGDSKQFTFYKNIQVSIRSLQTDLIQTIESNLSEFFMRHNFGNRQSKGFGSFFPADQNRFSISPLMFWFEVDVNNPEISRVNYSHGRPQRRFFQFVELFKTINLFYNTLRSGLNQNNRGNESIYFKSMMFMYAKQKGFQWDKKKIKENFYPRNLREQKNRHGNSDALNFSTNQSFLMRDLLGLASESKWWAEYKDTISTENVGGHIERFKSPILFKPIEVREGVFQIFFEGNQEEVNQIVNKPFKISSRNARKPLEISTPEKFDINDFLKFAFSIDVKSHAVIKKGNYSKDLETLSTIYSQLKTQTK